MARVMIPVVAINISRILHWLVRNKSAITFFPFARSFVPTALGFSS